MAAGYFEYKEGYVEYENPEDATSSSLGCLQIIISDDHVQQFDWTCWPAIEYFASWGLVKDTVGNSRTAWLGLKARIDIPIGGTAFQVKNGALCVNNLPLGWPTTVEGGWQEYHDKKTRHLLTLLGS